LIRKFCPSALEKVKPCRESKSRTTLISVKFCIKASFPPASKKPGIVDQELEF
jgi:hypothetical protein